MWQELLGIEQVGIDDDFFELGGHSLLATQIIARLRSMLSADLSLESIFEAPTVRQLSQLITAQSGDQAMQDKEAMLAKKIREMSPEQRQKLLEKARQEKG